MNVLVLNVGSATLKFQLIRTDAERMDRDGDERLASGSIERIGGEAILTLRPASGPSIVEAAPIRNVREAVGAVLEWLLSPQAGPALASTGDIDAVGHRVVHGGETFRASVLVDERVLHELERMIDLAPLHNPHNLRGIRAAQDALGHGVPQGAVFDTAFHQTLPERAYLYAIPYSLYRRHRIRRYGFHGTSHRYVAYRYRKLTGRTRDQTNLVTLHLGSGASACAIRGGQSVDTSMGFTPLEGLVMGTRSGDIDPAIPDFVAGKEGLGHHGVELLLNKQSGLLGVSGLTDDMRDLLAEIRDHDDRRAKLAVDLFCYRVRKYVGAYLAAMGGADAVVFTGGIGENSPEIRTRILAGLGWLGLDLDERANSEMAGGRAGRISADGARLEAWVIPTDEELLIARDTVRLMLGIPNP
jgi:acetate kinase